MDRDRPDIDTNQDLTGDDDQAADRLAFALLGDAFRDLAVVLRNLDGASANAMFDMIEGRMVGALARLHADRAEGANSGAVIAAAGSRLSAVMDEARGREGVPSHIVGDRTKGPGPIDGQPPRRTG